MSVPEAKKEPVSKLRRLLIALGGCIAGIALLLGQYSTIKVQGEAFYCDVISQIPFYSGGCVDQKMSLQDRIRVAVFIDANEDVLTEKQYEAYRESKPQLVEEALEALLEAQPRTLDSEEVESARYAIEVVMAKGSHDELRIIHLLRKRYYYMAFQSANELLSISSDSQQLTRIRNLFRVLDDINWSEYPVLWNELLDGVSLWSTCELGEELCSEEDIDIDLALYEARVTIDQINVIHESYGHFLSLVSLLAQAHDSLCVLYDYSEEGIRASRNQSLSKIHAESIEKEVDEVELSCSPKKYPENVPIERLANYIDISETFMAHSAEAADQDDIDKSVSDMEKAIAFLEVVEDELEDNTGNTGVLLPAAYMGKCELSSLQEKSEEACQAGKSTILWFVLTGLEVTDLEDNETVLLANCLSQCRQPIFEKTQAN